MGLEQVYSCLLTLKKLRSAPLGMVPDDFCSWLLNRGFHRETVRKHLSIISHLNQHLCRQGVATGQILTSKDIEGFLEAYPAWCRHRGSQKDATR